jgi:predicted Rdx family selenoprotein
LKPGVRGQFEFVIDGQTTYSKAATGKFPELQELKDAVAAKLK